MSDDDDEIDPAASSTKKRAKSKSSTKSSSKNAKSSSARRSSSKDDDDEESGERSASKSSRTKKGAPKAGDSKVVAIKVTFGIFVVMLLIGGYKIAKPAPTPPPPKVIDDLSTLKTAQQHAKDGYKKSTEGNAAWNSDRAKGERLIRAAIADFDRALEIYEDLFEKYPGEKYEYLGPEVDRLNQTKMQCRKMLPVR
jgi:hypothetical protein